MERGRAVLYRLDRRARERLSVRARLVHGDEPLIREHRLDDHFAARAHAHRMPMRFHLCNQPLRFEVYDYAFAAFLAREALVWPGRGVHPRTRIHHGNLREIMSPPDLEVVRVMRRRDLDRAGTEFAIHRCVRDYRDLAPKQREPHCFSNHPAITLVIGIHRDCSVTEHRLGPRRRDRYRARSISERIADIPKAARHIFVIDFEVGDRSLASRTPVDQPPVAIDEPLVVERHEGARDGARKSRIECEALAAPVARRAQPPQLMEYLAAVRLAPFPYALDEALAPELMAVLPFFRELALDHVLRRDSGVIGSRQPQRVVALHPARAHDHVVQRDVERMPEMELAGNIGRRDYDRKDLLPPLRILTGLRIRVGRKIAAVNPELEPVFLRRLGIECLAQFQEATAVLSQMGSSARQGPRT